MKKGIKSLFLLTIYGLLLHPFSLTAAPVEVVILGVSGSELENVQAVLELPVGLVRDDEIVGRRWLKHFIGQIPAKAGKALEPFGYYETITSTQLENYKKNKYRLQVQIKTGEPVRVATIRVDLDGVGKQTKKLLQLVETFPLVKGDVLRQDLYEQGKGELKATALDLGFLQADFTTHEICVNRSRKRADINLKLDTGRRFRFGKTLLNGAPNYPDEFLFRHLNFSEGDVFSHEKLGKTLLNFIDSDRFKNVMIFSQQELADQEYVPVSIRLVPSVRRQLRPGVGYGTDTGGRFSLRYKDINLMHQAHLLEVDLLVAQRRQSLVSEYTVPSARNLESHTSFRLGYTAEDVDTYETRSIFAEVDQLWGFGDGQRGAVFIRLSQEDYIVGQEDNRSRMVIPGIRFFRRRYQDPIRPTKGYAFSLETRGALQALGSDISLLQIFIAGNTIVPLPARMSLLVRMEGAISFQDEKISEVPASLRFFAGGDRSVRGYAYQSIGPEDALGETIGGRHLAVVGLEVERALWDSWGVAFFYDAGNAFNTLSAIKWAQGAGVGVRYYTQVVPVKIDIARQVGEQDPAWRLHLNVGFAW
jgi:translocation and assembly module TamA